MNIRKSYKHLFIFLVALLCVFFIQVKVNMGLMHSIDDIISNNSKEIESNFMVLIIYSILLLPSSIIMEFSKSHSKKGIVFFIKSKYIRSSIDGMLYNKGQSSEILSVISQDMDDIEKRFINSVFEIMTSIMYFISGLYLIIYVNKYVVLICLLSAVLSIFLSLILGLPMRKIQSSKSRLFKKYTKYVQSYLDGFLLFKANRLEEKIQVDFDQQNRKVQNESYKMEFWTTVLSAMQNSITYISMILLVASCSYLSITGSMTFGGAVLIITSATKVFNPLIRISESLIKMNSTLTLLKTVLRSTDGGGVEKQQQLDCFDTEIRFSNVSLSYGDNLILDDVNLSIIKGKKYLISGNSGSGKSTLLSMIMAKIEADKGIVSIDDKPVNMIVSEDINKHIALYKNEVYIFDDTLINNISLYKSYSPEAIKKSIEIAGLEELVSSLELGIETVINTKSRKLSGGERSRIDIARCQLSNKSIILLDEVFANINKELAVKIERNILRNNESTILHVTHAINQENLSLYDYLIKVREGRVSCTTLFSEQTDKIKSEVG